MRTSVLIPSYQRPARLSCCLESLNRQSVLPDEVIVIWQAGDTETRDVAQSFSGDAQYTLRPVHSALMGIVPAENAGLRAASGDIFLFIDDDAVAHPEWVACHLAHYLDPSVGAVGAPVRNHHLDGSPYPLRRPARLGELTFYGRVIGNLFDHPPEWRWRHPLAVDHLAAGNMSLRRTAFKDFEAGLQPYWQAFELDACLQVRAHGLRVVFDFANSIDHYPTNSVFKQDRSGDLLQKVFHQAYNHAFILAKYSHWPLRLVRLLYMLLIGSSIAPGVAGFFFAVGRFGNTQREFRILTRTLECRLRGWTDGSRCRVHECRRVLAPPQPHLKHVP